jgi:hypothetical protein
VEPSSASRLAAQLRVLLARTIALVRTVTETDTAWNTPQRRSMAGEELAAEESRSDRPTGSWPWLAGLLVARWALQVAIEHAVGLEKLMDAETPSYAADGVCRGVLESTSLAWWLLDLDITAEQRLARSLVYRLHTAHQTARAINALDLGNNENRADYGELPDSVGREVTSLGSGWGWDQSRRRVIHNGPHESWPSYTERVAALVGLIWPQHKLPYAILSAVAHTELLGIARNLTRHDGDASLRPAPDPTGLWHWQDAYLALGALVFTADRAAHFLGLSEQLDALRAWTAELDQVLPALRPATQ